jgi:hypothetical protein
MKSHFFRASSILGALLILVALSLAGIAQQPTTQQRQPLEEQLPELRVQELDSETLRIRVPTECKKRPVTYQHGVGTGVTLSPALASFLTGKPHKGYNNAAVDTAFGDSFKLDSCRVCYATLEVQVRHQPGTWSANAPNYSNDSILAGAAPFPANMRFIGPASIWNSTLPNPKVLTLSTTPGGLNNLNSYLFGNTPAWVDVVAQDDTSFDYAKLTVWYY